MNKERIQKLIDKYDEGITSNVEEKELRAFFSRQSTDSLPKEWAVYKALFAFVDCETAKEGKKTETFSEGDTIKTTFRQIFTAKRLSFAAACAAIAIAVATHYYIYGDNENYAVIDGNVVTDKNVVMSEAEAALQMVAYSDGTFGALDDFANIETE